MENRALGEHIISFSAQNAPFSRKRSRTDLCGERSAAPSPACTCSVRLPQRPIRLPRHPVRLPHRPVQLPHRPARLLRRPAWLPHDPAPSSRRHDCHSSLTVPASPTPVLASLRQPLLPPGRAAKETGTKKSAFFGVFVKFLLLLQHIVVTTLYPRRNGLHAASASLLTRGIPMTGDVPAAGSEQHTETIYL